jgi:hypothetical protein
MQKNVQLPLAVLATRYRVERVFDVGALESGAPWMVMDRVEANDLSALLRSNGRLPIEVSANVEARVTSAKGRC